MKKRWLCFGLAVLLCFGMIGCKSTSVRKQDPFVVDDQQDPDVVSSERVSSSVDSLPIGADVSSREIPTKWKNSEQISQWIDAVQIDPGFQSFFSYRIFPEAYRQLSAVELAGVPVFCDKLKEAETITFMHQAWMSVLYDILRLESVNTVVDDYYSFNGYEQVKAVLTAARTNIPEILASAKTEEEKYTSLLPYGVLVIPYIEQEIKDKNPEALRFCATLGLHHSTVEYKALYFELYDEQEENWRESQAFLAGADDFNYKKWLRQNKDELAQIQQYINTL